MSAPQPSLRKTFAPWTALAFAPLLLLGATSDAFAQAEAGTGVISTGVRLDGSTEDLTQFLQQQKKIAQLRGQIFNQLLAGKATDEEFKLVEVFFMIRACELTWPSTEAKDSTEQRRIVVKRDLRNLMTGTETQLHDRFNGVLKVNLPRIIDDPNCLPASRQNAMILLGMLDQVESDTTKQRAAVPWSEATAMLIKYAAKKDLTEYLRIAAWMGLARQSELQIGDTNARKAIADEAQALLESNVPTTGYSLAGHHWARKLALQTVGGLGLQGTEVNRGILLESIVRIVGNDQEPLFLRREAALVLGLLDPTFVGAGTTNVKPADMVKAMGNLTLFVLRAGGASTRTGDAPANLALPEDVFPTPTETNKKQFVEATNYYLNCLAIGLGGRNNGRGLSKAFASDQNAKKLADELVNSHINAAVIGIIKPNQDATKIVADLVFRQGEVKKWLEANSMLAAQGAPPNAVGNAR